MLENKNFPMIKGKLIKSKEKFNSSDIPKFNYKQDTQSKSTKFDPSQIEFGERNFPDIKKVSLTLKVETHLRYDRKCFT